jgi:type VI secretion system FHA domain protein
MSPGVERVAAEERAPTPPIERRDARAEPAMTEDTPPEPPPVVPTSPAGPAPRSPPERPAISAALSADLVSLRRPGVAEVAGQRIIDPVAVLRQRGADVSGASRKGKDAEPADRNALAAVAENLDGMKVVPSPAQGQPSQEPARPVIPLAQPSAKSEAGGDAHEAGQQGELFEAFWGGLGLDPAQIPAASRAELLAEFGHALREAVDGLVPVLRARRSLKDELRIDQTRLQARENNPLKFLPSGDAVLQAVIARKLTGFVSLPQAVREGFNDIKAHEVAAIVALEAVIKNLLARFDPNAISGQGGTRFFGRGPDKAKLWDQFVALHAALCNNPEETTHKLVGEEFARAYAQQVDIVRRGGQ